MEKYNQDAFTGERSLYGKDNLEVVDSIFYDGESPLKECHDLYIKGCIFKWKYPLWYSNHIVVEDTTWLDTARSGVWYTNYLEIKNSIIEAPKQFRRCHDITLDHVEIPNALETMWNVENIKMDHVNAKGDYFGLNAVNVEIDHFYLSGNYAFDGGKNIHVKNSTLISKDSFWNCENVVVENCKIIGEYLAWNSKNVTFINCTIESNQGLCYIENLKLTDCKLINTDLCFELCKDIDATITSTVESIKNPISGTITVKACKELILDPLRIDPSKTEINILDNKDLTIMTDQSDR